MILDNMSDTESQCDFEWIREADGSASLEDLCEKHPAVKALCERFESLTEKYEATRAAALVDPSARVARLARLLSRRARVQKEAAACRAVVVLQARARRVITSKSDVRARLVAKCLSLSKSVAAKAAALDDLGAKNLALCKTVATNTSSLKELLMANAAKTRALSDRSGGEGFRVIRNKDAFPGSDARIVEVDLTKPFDCFKICRAGSYGGFATFGGHAFFRAESPDECYVNLKKCHPAHGVTFYLRTDDLFTTPAATPIPDDLLHDLSLSVGKLVTVWPVVGSRVELRGLPEPDAPNGERGVVVKDRGVAKEFRPVCHRFDVKLDLGGFLYCKVPHYYLKPEP